MLKTKQSRIKRHKKIRAGIFGTKERPRLCVFFSNNHIYAQLINDEKGLTLVSANDLKMKKSTEKVKGAKNDKTGKSKSAFEVGKLIAKLSAEKKIESVVFDRGGFKYHGVVKSLADGARQGGLKF